MNYKAEEVQQVKLIAKLVSERVKWEMMFMISPYLATYVPGLSFSWVEVSIWQIRFYLQGTNGPDHGVDHTWPWNAVFSLYKISIHF